MDLNKNTHYTNEHGQQLKDFMLQKDPELFEMGALFNVLKYHIRAGKKDGESKEKDLGKRDDYINELLSIDITQYQSLEVMQEWAEDAKKKFEEFEG